MVEPITSIIAGGAAGGLAGKLAESAWDSGRRWLSERFGSHAPEVQRRAEENVTSFILQLAARVKAIEDAQRIDRHRMLSAEQHPAFSALLQQTLLIAAQTDADVKHEILASLVAERLTVDADTTVALAASMAANAIAKCTARQLRLLALMCFIDEIRPKHLESEQYFHKWLDAHLRPFTDDHFETIDARHLVALACISYDPTSERNLEAVLVLKALPSMDVGLDLSGVTSVEQLQGVWVEVLAGVQLTSVGSIVGGLAHDKITGASLGLPNWR